MATLENKLQATAAQTSIDDPIDRVLRLLEAGMRLDCERMATRRIFHRFQAASTGDDNLRAELAGNYAAWRAAVREAIADAQRQDHFLAHDAGELAETLVGLAEGLGMQGMFDPKALPPARLRQRLAHAIEHLAEGSPFG